MASIFATTAEVQRKVGANVSSVSNVEAFIDQYMAEAEALIDVITGVNYSSTFSGLDAGVRDILKRWAICLSAIDVINYDTSGMTKREAETRMDVLSDEAAKCEQYMKEKRGVDFLNKL